MSHGFVRQFNILISLKRIFFSFWNICDSNTREADHDALNVFAEKKIKFVSHEIFSISR